MKLTSKAMTNGYMDPEYGIKTTDESQIKYGIPQRSFPLEWDDVPEGTESFAIICMDYDNVEDEGVPWVHWLVSDIDKDRRSLEDNEAAKGTLIQGMTSWALPYGPYEGIPAEGFRYRGSEDRSPRTQPALRRRRTHGHRGAGSHPPSNQGSCS